MKNNRRHFLKQTSLAAASLCTKTFSSKWSPLSFGEEKIFVGIIGTGDRGTGLMSLINEIDGIEVAAICDIIPLRLAKAMTMAPDAHPYDDYRSLLENKDVNAVMICTPFSTHDEIVLDAIDAGKHIYCEKTMAKGIEEIQAVVRKVTDSELVFQVGHQYHSSPLYNKVREMIQEGYLGKITAYHCQWNRHGDWRRPVHDPKWERMINWRMYMEYSGGLTAELCSHQIDFINWVSNSHPSKIVGFGGIDYWNDGRETFDNVHLMYEYPDGLDASFVCTTTNSYDDYKIRILGEKGTIILDYTSGKIYGEPGEFREKGVVDGVSGASLLTWQAGEGVPIEAPGNDPTLDALKQFYNSVVLGAPVISNINTGASTAKCVQISLDALYTEQVKYWDDYPDLAFD